jgi:signal recognition particle subunit SRP68
MIETLKAPKQGDGKKTRPQDFARLFEIIVQNLSEILHLPGVEEQATLTHDINAQILGYKAFKCFYTAQTYLSVKKWKETLALYERCLDYASHSIEGYKTSQLDSNKKSKDAEALEELVKMVDGLKYSVHASSILESQDTANPATTTVSTTNTSKPLDERFDEYIEDPSLMSKKPNLTRFPPDFEPIPAKPLFFDLALSLVQFPSLADKVEQKQQAGGITGYIKGWLPWGKK